MIETWKPSPVAGVIGGLGPLATANYLEAVVEQTAATVDQDHVELLVAQHSSTPDRTAFLLGESDLSPVPALTHDAKMLAGAGVDFLVIPCNTAHAFVDEVRAVVDVDVLDILETTVAALGERAGGPTRVGLLATDGTRLSQIYQRELTEAGHEVVLPDDVDQARIMALIYDQIKAGAGEDGYPVLAEIVEDMYQSGAEYVILGCTELPVAAKRIGLLRDRRVVDSVTSLAQATVVRAGNELR